MRDKNEVELRGHLCEDAEVKFTPNGTAVTTLRVATNRRWKDRDGKDCEEATFHSVVVFGKQAEFIRNRELKKGTRVEIEGRLQNRSWDDKDGKKQYRTEVVAEVFTDCTPPTRNQPDGYHEEP